MLINNRKAMTGNEQPLVNIPDNVKKWRQDVEKGGEWEEWYVFSALQFSIFGERMGYLDVEG